MEEKINKNEEKKLFSIFKKKESKLEKDKEKNETKEENELNSSSDEEKDEKNELDEKKTTNIKHKSAKVDSLNINVKNSKHKSFEFELTKSTKLEFVHFKITDFYIYGVIGRGNSFYNEGSYGKILLAEYNDKR
jgi:hypothetical protein